MGDQEKVWTDFYASSEVMYPPEAVIRLFKGEYPNQKMPKPRRGDSILDIGCGDGRNYPLFSSLGMDYFGMEISDDICEKVHKRFNLSYGRVRTGLCSGIPFQEESFDYAIAWNSMYYVGLGTGDFDDHINEVHSVLKPNGWLIVSVPQPSCFIFDDSELTEDGDYRIIRSEYFGLRENEKMRFFSSPELLTRAFSKKFFKFSHSSIDIDQFGLRYSWWVFTAKKRDVSHP